MKKIEAIIRKTRFEDVKEALLAADIEWFSYYDVRGEGKMRQARIYRGVMYDTSSIERVLVSIVVRDKNVEKAVAAKPGCMKNTSIAASSIHTVLIETPRSATLFETSATDSVANNNVVIIFLLDFLLVLLSSTGNRHLSAFTAYYMCG